MHYVELLHGFFVLSPHFLPLLGMTGNDVLTRLEVGYRMPRPSKERFECPESLYDMMLKCWDKIPENRPTFQYLYDFFDDYFVSTEPNYDDQKY